MISASILSTYAFTVVLAGRGYSFPATQAFQYTFWFCSGLFIASILVALFAKEVIGRKAKLPDVQLSEKPLENEEAFPLD